MGDGGVELVEVAALDPLQRVGKPVQLAVLQRVFANAGRRSLGVTVAPLEAGTVSLAPES